MSYDYWEKALANPAALHHREFSITTSPEPGFYRTRRLNEPVAIWIDAKDGLVVSVNGSEVFESDYETVWLNCAKSPVTEAAYHQAVETGRWDDLDEVVASGRHDRRNDPESRIDELIEQAKTYRDISDDETAQRAISLRAAILEQHKRADDLRSEQKAPHLKAAREVDELWMHVVKKAKSAADVLRALVEGWETKKRKAAREAEAARIAAEQAGREPEVLEDFPPVCVPPQDQIRSGYGRAASVRTKMVAVQITNLLDAVAVVGTRESVTDAMMKEAQKILDAGAQSVPGFAVEERAVVR